MIYQKVCLSALGINNIQSYACYTSTVVTNGYMVYTQCPKNNATTEAPATTNSIIPTSTTKSRNPDNQNCTTYVDCLYCPSIYASGCSCD